MGHDEFYAGQLVFRLRQTADVDILQGNEPPFGYAGAIGGEHNTANKRGTVGAAVAGDVHNVGVVNKIGVIEKHSCVLNALLPETAEDAQRFAVLDFLAAALTHNLHINAALVQVDKLLVAYGQVVLIVELFLSDDDEVRV